MSVNASLRAIYSDHWQGLARHGAEIRDPVPTNPMLLQFNEVELFAAHKRIMICGQETWGWNSFGTSIDSGMNSYHRFFIEKHFYPGYGRSAFWKAFRFFESSFAEAFPGEKLQFIYQNISKIGRDDDQTGVTNEIRNLERQHFPVFKKEVELLKPDICLFLTGPNRDHDIEFHFPDVRFSSTQDEPNPRRLAWVSSRGLPQRSLRLYHPTYFRAWTSQYKRNVVSLILASAS